MAYELRIIPGCPHGTPALELFRAALAAEGKDPEHVKVREVISESEATALHFQGSPSFMADGHDLFPVKSAPALSCRIYRSDEKVAGLPSAASLRAALRDSGSGSSGRGSRSAPLPFSYPQAALPPERCD